MNKEKVMDRFAIRDRNEQGALAFDLVDLLQALGDFTDHSEWWISPSGLDCFGEASDAIEEVAKSGNKISGAQLKMLASQISQVIDGEFSGYASSSPQPDIVMLAVDSTEWEVNARNLSLANMLRKRFSEVVDISSD